MAHGDYNCCAICDSKLDYNAGDARTKEEICDDCIERSIALGHPCVRPTNVVEYIKTLNDQVALIWLHAMDFDPCYYENDLDKYLIERGLIETGVKDGGKWGKRLKPIAVQPSDQPVQ
jgi:hypothetical protein